MSRPPIEAMQEEPKKKKQKRRVTEILPKHTKPPRTVQPKSTPRETLTKTDPLRDIADRLNKALEMAWTTGRQPSSLTKPREAGSITPRLVGEELDARTTAKAGREALEGFAPYLKPAAIQRAEQVAELLGHEDPKQLKLEIKG